MCTTFTFITVKFTFTVASTFTPSLYTYIVNTYINLFTRLLKLLYLVLLLGTLYNVTYICYKIQNIINIIKAERFGTKKFLSSGKMKNLIRETCRVLYFRKSGLDTSQRWGPDTRCFRLAAFVLAGVFCIPLFTSPRQLMCVQNSSFAY